MKRRVCVLVSGGLDSAVLTGEMLARGREVYPLYVREGLRWEAAELHWLKRFLRRLAQPKLKPLTVLDAPARELWGKPHWSLTGRGVPGFGSAWTSVYLPGRNLVLLSQAGVFSACRGIGEIAQAVLKGNPFRDATPSFRRAMEKTYIETFGRRIVISYPYEKLHKEDMTRRVPGLPLHLTFSCLRPKGVSHCGTCHKCEERTWALGLAGLGSVSAGGR